MASTSKAGQAAFLRYAAGVLRRRQYVFWGGVCGALAWLVSATHSVHAASQEQWQLGVDTMAVMLNTPSQGRFGAGGGLDVQYGLTDAWAVRAAIAGAMVSTDQERHATRTLGQIAAGTAYTWDVVRVLPVIEAGLSGLVLAGDQRATQYKLGVQLGLGADYLLDRRWSLGLVGRFSYHPMALAASDGGSTALATLSLRLLYRLD